MQISADALLWRLAAQACEVVGMWRCDPETPSNLEDQYASGKTIRSEMAQECTVWNLSRTKRKLLQ
eukprot:6461693-Amphidinium_carterae.1